MNESLNYANLPDWLQWLIGLTVLASAIVGLIVLAKKAWPVVTRFVNTVNSLSDLPEFMAEQRKFRVDTAQSLQAQDTQIADIHHEVHFNNGSSVKDATTRIETRQRAAQKVLARIPAIEKGVAGLYDRVNQNEADAAQDRKDIAEARQELEDTRPAVRRPSTKPKE